jgi:hypothetical protein
MPSYPAPSAGGKPIEQRRKRRRIDRSRFAHRAVDNETHELFAAMRRLCGVEDALDGSNTSWGAIEAHDRVVRSWLQRLKHAGGAA